MEMWPSTRRPVAALERTTASPSVGSVAGVFDRWMRIFVSVATAEEPGGGSMDSTTTLVTEMALQATRPARLDAAKRMWVQCVVRFMVISWVLVVIMCKSHAEGLLDGLA